MLDFLFGREALQRAAGRQPPVIVQQPAGIDIRALAEQQAQPRMGYPAKIPENVQGAPYPLPAGGLTQEAKKRGKNG